MRTHLHTARIVVRIILVLGNNYTGPGSGFGVNGITYLHSSQSGLLLIDTKFIIIYSTIVLTPSSVCKQHPMY